MGGVWTVSSDFGWLIGAGTLSVKAPRIASWELTYMVVTVLVTEVVETSEGPNTGSDAEVIHGGRMMKADRE